MPHLCEPFSSPWRRLRPLGAVTFSLATVLVLIALVGLAFVPHEIRQLAIRRPVCVLNYQILADGRRAVLLTRWQDFEKGGNFVWEVVLADLQAGGERTVLVPGTSDPLAIALSFDKSRLAVARGDGRILTVDLTATNPSPRPIGRYSDGGIFDVGCSARGEILVAGGPDGLRAWDSDTGYMRWTRQDIGHAQWVLDAANHRILVDSLDGELLELDLFSGITLRLIARFDHPGLTLALSDDGSRIARLGHGGHLALFDRATGRPLWPTRPEPRLAGFSPRIMAFSPCSSVLITGDDFDPNRVIVWQISTGQKIGELRAHRAAICGLDFQRDGRLRTWSVDGTLRTWRSPAEHPDGQVELVQRFDNREGLMSETQHIPPSRMAMRPFLGSL